MERAMRWWGLFVCCLVVSQSGCQRASEPEKTSRSTSAPPSAAHKHRAAAKSKRETAAEAPGAHPTPSAQSPVEVTAPAAADHKVPQMKRRTAASPPPTSSSAVTGGTSAIIDAELKKLAPGRILYNPPSEMKVGVKDRIEVRISKNQIEDLTRGLEGAGVPKIENLRAGDSMKVRLTGDGFEIAALDSDEQLVSDDGFTQWCYDVTPVHSGDRVLSLIVTVRIAVPGVPDAVRDYAPFTRTIHVHVNPVYSTARFVQSNWQWLVGTLVIPLAVLAWNRMKKRPPGKRGRKAMHAGQA